MKKTIAFLLGTSLGSAFSHAGEKPNIVFILADDLGYGDLGCYGNEVIETPFVDRLCREGISFSDCYAGASVSSPSRCCLMTGLHTGHSRIRGNMCRTGGIAGEREGMGTVRRIHLLPQDSTLANVLSRNGYRTCLVNKWHLDGFEPQAGPLDRGFDEFYGWLINEPASHNYYPTVRYRNREAYRIRENANTPPVDHNTDRATDEAIDFIRRNQQRPFFLYLAYNAPHVPLDAKSWGIYNDRAELSDNDKSYAALITHMDECIGQVMNELEALGLDKNTIVVFASDNGGAKAAQTKRLKPNGELRGWKGELYEGGIRVPLIVRFPDKRNAGKRSSFPCYFPDILPTIVDLTGSFTQVATDGVSIAPELEAPNSLSSKRYLYWEQYPREGISQAVRYGDWKLIRQNVEQAYELYNLQEDRKEENNLAGHHPDIVRWLAGFMIEAHTGSAYWPVARADNE